MFFAFWEERLKRQLTDGIVQPVKLVSDLGIINEQIRREQALKTLPRHALAKLRLVIRFKLLFLVLFVAEVFVLQQ